MTQAPAGWYPDPDPHAAPGGSRFWDGQAWTGQVRAGEAPVVPPAPNPYQPYGQQAPNPYQPYGQQPYGQPTFPTRGVATTPDGQRLAGWWQRVVAYLLDMLLLVPVNIAVGWSFWRDIFSAYGDFFDASIKAAERGDPAPSGADLMTDLAGPMLWASLLSLAVLFVYQNGMLRWKQATLGKLALGLRVRAREHPGPMSWGMIVTRWFGQNIGSFFSVVPVLSMLTMLYPLVDSLWPLWDDKKQAVHDKVARTNVVRKG